MKWGIGGAAVVSLSVNSRQHAVSRGATMRSELHRAVLAEFLGTAMLVCAVVGSGIAASRLSEDVGLVLFQNTFATFGALVALIHTFAPVSGAHFNPVVSLVDHVLGGISRATLLAYMPAQVVGAIGGAVVANLMFDLNAIDWSEKARSGDGVWLGEFVATFGLIIVIFAMVRTKRDIWIPLSVASYIASAYYFTSSTSFANPAVTIGRTFSDTFAGIDPAHMPAFVGFQFAGGALGAVVVVALYPLTRSAQHASAEQ